MKETRSCIPHPYTFCAYFCTQQKQRCRDGPCNLLFPWLFITCHPYTSLYTNISRSKFLSVLHLSTAVSESDLSTAVSESVNSAVFGGVVAVAFMLIAALTVILIVVLLRSRRNGYSIKHRHAQFTTTLSCNMSA